MTTLDERLRTLADRLHVPREDDGTPATLQALMPCEPAVGEVAVACWTDSEGAELVELVRLDTGARIDDQAALRESLALLAMVETVEELASFDELGPLREALAVWDATDDATGGRFDAARERALQVVDALRALDPGEEVRIARTGMLDALGAALRDLERAWEQLEQAAEAWSDGYLERHERSEEAVEYVQSLWRILAVVRRGPLRTPVSTSLHAGREAGVAMATAIAEANGSAPA